MQKIADLCINLPVKRISTPYTYMVPERFEFLAPGWRVLVPFGNRRVEGFVVDVAEREDCGGVKLKEILDIVDTEPWFDARMLRIAGWMAEAYLCSLSETMRLFMPGKAGLTIQTRLVAADLSIPKGILAADVPIFDYIAQHGPLSATEIKKAFPNDNTEKLLHAFLQKKWLQREYQTTKRAVQKYEKIVTLASCLENEACEISGRRPAQARLLEYLRDGKPRGVAELKAAGFSTDTVQRLEQQGRIRVEQRPVWRNSYQPVSAAQAEAPALSDDQAVAMNRIAATIDSERSQTFLLYGITGSGKTQIYIEAVRKVRAAGKQAIVLVPEIGLTGQMVTRFQAAFGDDVLVIHSRLSYRERNDAIARMKCGMGGIVIGARSAIFMPAPQLGVIILDEEHDGSYKQEETPRYHTRDIAEKMADVHGAVLILGSATPSLESYYKAKTGVYTLLTLKSRIGGASLPSVVAVDMREELRMGRRNVISAALNTLIEETLQKGEQMIILLNRRGFSTFVLCRECGYVVSCADCTLPMVYHKNGMLQCHFCNTVQEAPDVCPKCASRYIKYFGTGTERLEFELGKQFPAARIVRMDRDTTGGKFGHAEILESFASGRYDILLGTQMVAKGHDVQNVTAVGVISADSGLNVPDFRGAERCYALISQAAGRAGRGARGGKVVVQTYNPEHYAVAAGAQQDYELFYEQEIELRRQLFYPPFSELLKLTVCDADERRAYDEAQRIRTLLAAEFSAPRHQIMGPSPAVIAQYKGIYRMNLLIKTTDLLVVAAFLRSHCLHNKDNIIMDIHPLNVT